MVNTGIYLRVSTEEQAKEGFSIRAQEEKLRSYAMAKDWHIFNVYADEGISGKDISGRPAIRRLIADVESKKINNVLIYKIDRLTRSTKNLIELVELFNQNNCAFNSLSESIDTGTATGRMFLKIVGIFAEFERENLAERVRLGLERKAKEGYTLSTYMPSYGYSKGTGIKVQQIDPKEAEIVRRVFNMYLNDDYSLSKIARLLNAEAVPGKKGSRWSDRTVKNLLTNVNHIGKVRYGMEDTGRYFEADGKHEPILDESIFYQVQDKLNKISKVSRTKRPGSAVYFCGVLYCPSCGGKYVTRWQYRNMKPSYPSYRCRNSLVKQCGNSLNISHLKLERAFLEYISQLDGFSKNRLVNPQPDSIIYDHTHEIKSITAEVKKADKKASEIMGLYITGIVDFKTYQDMAKLNHKHRAELESRLNTITQAQGMHCPITNTAANTQDSWQALNNQQRLKFIQKFITKIVVHAMACKGQYFNQIAIDEITFTDFN
ncbi:MAG: recombinase family protein [Defluviitaleaceae bacterium]|nr:recombinase family protein [Defluviitaleaceae bacterium]